MITALTTRELAAKLYGRGEQSAGAHNALYDALRTLPPTDVATIDNFCKGHPSRWPLLFLHKDGIMPSVVGRS